MQFVTLEFDREEAARAALSHLWDKLKVTGEIGLRRQGSRWLLEIAAERDISAATLDKLGGRRLGDM